jgi:23S rRNA (adenine-N6)-dimethyltransferase
MYLKIKLLSQNFFTNPELVSKLVAQMNLKSTDTIVEIGAGQGIITSALTTKCAKIFALEIDPELTMQLKQKFKYSSQVEVIQTDVLQYKFPAGEYKVVGNIPFSITSDIIYKLLYYSNPPQQSYLVMQKEAAEKFSGIPHTTQFSLLAYPYFKFENLWKFKKSDFYPPPSVDTVLLKITKRPQPLLSPQDELQFKTFIKYAFSRWKKNLKIGLKQIFTYNQWKHLSRDHHFHLHATPTDLTHEQWLAIFAFYKTLKSTTLE